MRQWHKTTCTVEQPTNTYNPECVNRTLARKLIRQWIVKKGKEKDATQKSTVSNIKYKFRSVRADI